MLYVLSIANTTPDAIAPALEAAGIAATILDSLGVAAPWPAERGVTLLIAANGDDVPHYGVGSLATFARQWCKDHGETCAAPTIVPASFTLLYASEA
jgi:hypothetical protein